MAELHDGVTPSLAKSRGTFVHDGITPVSAQNTWDICAQLGRAAGLSFGRSDFNVAVGHNNEVLAIDATTTCYLLKT